MSLTRRLFLRNSAAAGVAVAAPAAASAATATMAVPVAASDALSHGLSPEIAKLYSAYRRARRAVKEYGPIHTKAEEARYAEREARPQRPRYPEMTAEENEEFEALTVRELWKSGRPASFHERCRQHKADLAAFEEAAKAAKRDDPWKAIEATWSKKVSAEDDAAKRLFRTPSHNIHDLALKAKVAERLDLVVEGLEALSKDIRRMARAATKGGAS